MLEEYPQFSVVAGINVGREVVEGIGKILKSVVVR